MGIIKYFRKKYWEAAIFRGGRRIPFSCDGLTAVPDRAYALFTEKELEKIYNDRNEFYKKLMQMIDSLFPIFVIYVLASKILLFLLYYHQNPFLHNSLGQNMLSSNLVVSKFPMS